MRTEALVANERGLLTATVQPNATAGVTSHAARAMAAKILANMISYSSLAAVAGQSRTGSSEVVCRLVVWAKERELRARADGYMCGGTKSVRRGRNPDPIGGKLSATVLLIGCLAGEMSKRFARANGTAPISDDCSVARS